MVDSGVDWITCTAHDGDNSRRLLKVAEKLLEEEASAGCDVSPWAHKGYVGLTAGGVDVGSRVDGSIVRLRSKNATYDWWDVYQECDNVSRLDLQVTARFEGHEPDEVVHKAWRTVKRVKSFGKPQQWHLRRDSSRGNTLELGRRVSDRFGRCYNKEKESKLEHYRGCVRFEVETKKHVALHYAKFLTSKVGPYEGCFAIVQNFYEARGLVLTLPATGAPLISVHRRKTELDRWLEWAAIGVRPRVKDAIRCGKLPELVRALGLDHMVQIHDRKLDHGPSGPERSERKDGSL